MNKLEQFKLDMARVVDQQYIDTWLNNPNPAFDNRTPLELIDNGEIGKLYAMLCDAI